MNFTPIDLQSWPRGQMFYYFSKMAPTGYSMTVNMDVTELRKTVNAAGLKFFPVYLWLVTKNLNRQTEFKIAEKDGVLGFYDTLTPYIRQFSRGRPYLFFNVDGICGPFVAVLSVVYQKPGTLWQCPWCAFPATDAAPCKRLHRFEYPVGWFYAFRRS